MTWSMWLILSFLFFIVEIAGPGVFFFACLGIGALAGAAVSAIVAAYWLPWLAFVAVSLLSMYFIRPLAKKLLGTGHKPQKTNVDALIGQQALVIEDILPPHTGMVKVGGELWRASAAEPVAKNSYVEISAVQGTHLEVKVVK